MLGKTDVMDYVAFVDIEHEQAEKALRWLQNGGIKGRKFKVRRL